MISLKQNLTIDQGTDCQISIPLTDGNNKPIYVSLTKENHTVKLTIKDCGIGISKADQNRIFDRFERAVDKNKGGGLGLGLYIAKQIIDAHGGKIQIDSELGKGASFIVILPLNTEYK